MKLRQLTRRLAAPARILKMYDLRALLAYRTHRLITACQRRERQEGVTPFIIVCSARTGSNLLASLLNTNPAIRAAGEEFGEFLLRRRPWILAQPQQYAEYHWRAGANPAVRAVGFRLFADHCTIERCSRDPVLVRSAGHAGLRRLERLWSYLAARPALRVVHLSRSNMLRQYVSLQIAQRTRQFVVIDDRRPKRTGAVTVEPAALLRWATALTSYQKRSLTEFSHCASIAITYEELVSDPRTTLARIAAVLDVSPSFQMTTRHVRQNPLPVELLVANLRQVREFLAEASQRGDQIAAGLLHNALHDEPTPIIPNRQP